MQFNKKPTVNPDSLKSILFSNFDSRKKRQADGLIEVTEEDFAEFLGDFADFKDDVAFGDTVDAPPTLKFRGFEKSSSSKPAEGGGLLLSQKQSSRDGISSEPKAKKVKLSMAQKVNMERERLNVVAQYRAKKAASLNAPG